MASLYANENFPLKVVLSLRALGHDVLTSQEAGKAHLSIKDPEVLAFAAEKNRALYTFNRRDFIRLHYQIPKHAGIIVCTQDPDAQSQAEHIHQAIISEGILVGRLIRIH